MGTIELNMRLDVRDQDNSYRSITRRENQALTILGDCFHHRADYLDQGQPVPRLVTKLASADSATLHQLAAEMHQDCIAVYRPELGQGELLGPSASAWGEFDLARFHRFDSRKATDEEMAIAFGFA